jgi:hypothetical protein
LDPEWAHLIEPENKFNNALERAAEDGKLFPVEEALVH